MSIMSKVINPSSIGNCEAFINRNSAKAKHVISGEYNHFYIMTTEGYSVGFFHSKFANSQIENIVCWMSDEYADDVRAAVISRAARDI